MKYTTKLHHSTIFVVCSMAVFLLSFASCTRTKGNLGGHDYVDMGLPSGTLWATSNIGANSETEKGELFKWAQIEGSSWGEEWSLPTRDQIQELLLPSHTTCTYTTKNDVPGFEIKSVHNGATLFFPAAGSSSKDISGKTAYYWSKSSISPMSYDIMYFKSLPDSISAGVASYERSFTLSVRLVTKKQQ